MMARWHCRDTQQCDKYIGPLPIIGKLQKQKALLKIKSKLCQRLQTWKSKLLSQWSKEVLLKPIDLAISTFAMSYFKIPTNLCTELESLMTNF